MAHYGYKYELGSYSTGMTSSLKLFPASTRFKLCFFEKSFGSFFLFTNEVREGENLTRDVLEGMKIL